jgi:hypothetical protein
MSEAEIVSALDACNVLTRQVNENYTFQIVENDDGSWSVSLQLISDAVTGRPINLFSTVSSPDKLSALQAMVSQLESMLA